jgi:hypothetical protein
VREWPDRVPRNRESPTRVEVGDQLEDLAAALRDPVREILADDPD